MKFIKNILTLIKHRKELLKFIEERAELYEIIEEATDFIETYFPKYLDDIGKSLCLYAKEILPGDRVVIIKYTPGNQTHRLSIFSKRKTSMKELNLDLYCAKMLGDKMKDKYGFLSNKDLIDN